MVHMVACNERMNLTYCSVAFCSPDVMHSFVPIRTFGPIIFSSIAIVLEHFGYMKVKDSFVF